MTIISRMQTTVALLSIFGGAIVLCSIVRSQEESEASSASFRPRTDLRAEQDTRALRERLSKLRDVHGPINPLADYVERNQSKSKKERDLESEAKPTLNSSSSGYRSEKQSQETPSNRTKNVSLLPGPIYSVTNANVRSSQDSFFPVQTLWDLESTVVPTLPPPVLASVQRVPVSLNPSVITSNYQPELPGGSGGIPGPSAILPNAPVLPNYGQPAPSLGGSGAAIQGSVPNMSAPGAILSPGPAAVMPGSGTVMPGTLPGTPNILANPIPGTVPSTVPVMPGTVIPAPAPYYPANPPTGLNAVPNSIVSPSDSTLPRYPRTAPIVNGAPFVSSPPCQFDASYMVSPRVYRPANDCCTTGYTTPPYSSQPTGSPFTYVPPTSMPGIYRNPPYPILIGFGQNLNNAYLSRGIFGQPKAYMDGQPVRNFLRYLLP